MTLNNSVIPKCLRCKRVDGKSVRIDLYRCQRCGRLAQEFFNEGWRKVEVEPEGVEVRYYKGVEVLDN